MHVNEPGTFVTLPNWEGMSSIAGVKLAFAMKPTTSARIGILFSALVLVHLPLTAAETKDGASRILTPVGAIRKGNGAGTIPPWQSGLTTPPIGWTPEMGYVDPFENEKPLATITAANIEQYRSNISPGLIELLKQYPDFRMPLYPTHRTAALPNAVVEQARKARAVTLKEFGIVNPDHSHIPFPQPRDGLEAIWNHLACYVGGGIERTAHSFPVRASGDWYKIGFRTMRRDRGPTPNALRT